MDELFKMIDESVLTESVKRDLQSAFNDAVNKKAEIIAENSIFEEKEKLNSEFDEKLNFLDEKCEEYKQRLEEEYEEKKNEYEEKIKELDEKFDQFSSEYVNNIDEKADEYIEELKNELNERIDDYLNYVVDEFIKESKEHFENDIIVERARALNASFNNFANLAGVDLSKLVNERNEVNTKLKDEVDRLTNENIKLMKENNNLIQEGVILEMCDDLTYSQASKFSTLAKKLVKFERNIDYKKKLEELKESICSVEKEKLNESNKHDVNESKTSNVSNTQVNRHDEQKKSSKPKMLFNTRFI